MRQQFKILLILVLSLSLIGILQFLVCTAIAIVQFPDGYSFQQNFLSELGLMTQPNHTLFNGSLVFLGMSLIPVFGLLLVTDPRNSISIRVTTIMGTLSALGIVGVGMWTYDRQFVLHHIALAVWLFPMLYMVVSFFYAVSRSPYVGIGFLGASLFMVSVMIYTLVATRTSSLQLLQRAVVVCGLIWVCFVVAFLWQSGRAMIDDWMEDDGSRGRQESRYLATLSQGQHRRD